MRTEILRKMGRLAAVATVGAGVAVLAVQPMTILSESAFAAKNASLAPEQLDQINKVSGFFNGFRTLTGQFGLVLRTGRTNVSYARAKLNNLERLPVRMLGVILNDFIGGIGQGHYSYADYISGYGAEDEEAVLDSPQMISRG